MATVTVTSFEEFLEAIAVAGDTVECPEGAEWDFADEEPLTETIMIKCAVINGNGTAIKNLRFDVPGYCIRNENACIIEKLHWDSIQAEYTEIFWYEESPLQMNECRISGEFDATLGYTVFYGKSDFLCCSINAVCHSPSQLLVGNNPEAGISKYCRYRLYTQASSSTPFNNALSPFNYCERCELFIIAPNAVTLAFCLDSETYKLSECVVRGTLGEASSAGYNCDCRDYENFGTSLLASTLNANYHEPEYLADWQRGAVCTDSQLRSVEYLLGLTGREAGNFPIGNFNDEWHTGDITVNGGYPYIPLMIDLPRIELHPVPQTPYISVYSMQSTQPELENTNKNGLAILTPTSCEVTEELNGAYTFTLEHPIDPESKWETLQLRNIVKINGQYFTILQTVINYTNNSGSVQVSGEHIWYQQNDSWVFPGDLITGANGSTFIDNLDARTERYDSVPGSMRYEFHGYSDLAPGGLITKDVGDDGCTPIDALIGSGGLIDQSGNGCAELYRYNFYYSINHRMEYAQDKAFDIRIGRDLKGITRNFDTSQFVSYFRAYGEGGGWWAVSWVLNSFLRNRSFPHHIIRSKKFNVELGDFYWENLINQGMAFFRRNAKPILGWEIDLEDVRNNPDFEIMHAERLKVGDSGNIYDSRFEGNFTAKISSTVYDAIRDKIIRVTIGDQAHFTSPATSTVEIEPDIIGGDLWIQDADGAFILDANGEQIMQEVIVNG